MPDGEGETGDPWLAKEAVDMGREATAGEKHEIQTHHRETNFLDRLQRTGTGAEKPVKPPISAPLSENRTDPVPPSPSGGPAARPGFFDFD